MPTVCAVEVIVSTVKSIVIWFERDFVGNPNIQNRVIIIIKVNYSPRKICVCASVTHRLPFWRVYDGFRVCHRIVEWRGNVVSAGGDCAFGQNIGIKCGTLFDRFTNHCIPLAVSKKMHSIAGKSRMQLPNVSVQSRSRFVSPRGGGGGGNGLHTAQTRPL